MALVLKSLGGFETGGLEEAFAVVGTPNVQDTVKNTGSYSLELVPTATPEAYDFEIFGFAVFVDDTFALGFRFRTGDLTPASDIDFFEARSKSGNINWGLRLKTDGDIAIINNGGTEEATGTPSLTVNTFGVVEVYGKLNGTTGEITVVIDGSQVVSDTTMDNLAVGNFELARLQGADDTSGNPTVYFDDFYILVDNDGGAVGADDLLGAPEVFGYQTSDTGTTNLANGSWDETGDTPGVEEADGTAVEVAGASSTTAVSDLDDGTNARGQEGGPAAGAADVSGTIHGAKWIFNLKRSNGNGTSLRYLYGNTGETATSSADIEAELEITYGIFQVISSVANVVPTASENFRVGLSAGTDDTGSREIFAADIWAMLLHVPAAVVFDPATFPQPQASEPVRARAPLRTADWFITDPLALTQPETSLVSKWFVQASEPVRVRPPLRSSDWFTTDPQALTQPEVTLLSKWYVPPSEPVRVRQSAVLFGGGFVAEPTDLVVFDPATFAHLQVGEPVRIKPSAQTAPFTITADFGITPAPAPEEDRLIGVVFSMSPGRVG